MELQIWMGRAGAGKSRRVLETMQELSLIHISEPTRRS